MVASSAIAVVALLPAAGGAQLRSAPSASLQQTEAVRSVEDLPRPVRVEELRALRSFFERVDVSGVGVGLARPVAGTELTIQAVVARLPAEWEAPFFFVQGTVDYVPYAGSVRGARGALESRGGNAVDQALLLAALLEARGVETRLARGRLDWADAARLVVGSSTPAAPEPGDPWPRWLEGAADHWWVQAQRDGEWINLDPSFADAAVGERVAAVSEWHEQLPAELRARVRLELRRGDLIVAETEISAARIVGETVLLEFAAQSADAVALWELSETLVAEQLEVLERIARAFGSPPRGAFRQRPSAFRRIFLDPDAGPWMARFRVPGQVLAAGPFDESDLDSLSVRVAVRAPRTPVHALEVSWGGGASGTLAVVVGAGRVPDGRLAAEAGPLYAALNRLAGLEQAARVSMLPPVSYFDATETLYAAARDSWSTFEQRAPGVLAWAALQGIDRVSDRSPGGSVVRQGLRLAAAGWRPPDGTRAGLLEVVVSDPVTIGHLTGLAPAASLRAANGLLQSAVLSQVLNRLAERAPETAFDATLRAIGTAQDISVFSAEEELPGDWPPVVRAEAILGLRAGYAVMAPTLFDEGHSGWWHVGIVDGEMVGWVPGAQAALNGRVALGPDAPLEDLETLLASLPSLHRATRWLADLPGSSATALASVPASACASATVVADVLATNLPAAFPHADVLSLCSPR